MARMTKGIVDAIRQYSLDSKWKKMDADKMNEKVKEIVEALFTAPPTPRKIHIRVDAFAEMTGLSPETAERVLEEHGTPVVKEGWYEIESTLFKDYPVLFPDES